MKRPAASSRCPSATRCSAASSTRSASPSTAGPVATKEFAPSRRSRRRHRSVAGQGAAADRHQGHRLDDPDRPRPARADHRRPPDGQDRRRGGHDHQPEGRTSSASTTRSGRSSPRSRRWSAPSRTARWILHRRRRVGLRPRRCSTSARIGVRHGRSSSATAAATRCASTTTSKHAQAYREISLLLRRPPGREGTPATCSTCTRACSSARRS